MTELTSIFRLFKTKFGLWPKTKKHELKTHCHQQISANTHAQPLHPESPTLGSWRAFPPHKQNRSSCIPGRMWWSSHWLEPSDAKCSCCCFFMKSTASVAVFGRSSNEWTWDLIEELSLKLKAGSDVCFHHEWRIDWNQRKRVSRLPQTRFSDAGWKRVRRWTRPWRQKAARSPLNSTRVLNSLHGGQRVPAYALAGCAGGMMPRRSDGDRWLNYATS